ncbi:hypothetical protein CHH28_12625 [Bacterioplanes sanyensis]|uniref:Peptidase M48 domain-containing protein n=1 Tax=Bacterioplanes sanyensis TaxID=1249553 RepID=A0A222FKB0_9GAMM|nr:M48 family metalloprotease [Bacterioplanes sanyensis]ASP39465.1 hypothetical protein CHH28_12625 [Bacterioplanes sanyensis]
MRRPLTLFIVTLITVLTCATSRAASNDLPELGDGTSGVVSLQQEHELGRTWLRQLRRQAPVIESPLAKQYLENLVYQLVPYSDVSSADLEFIIVDQAALNAFAVPGGIVGINYGLLMHARDEDELAAVLAHELAHLSQRHFARRIEQSQKQQPIALATLLASLLLIASNNPDVGFAGLASAQAASIQEQLAYSREWEREADRLGIRTLAAAGLDPHAMTSMFEQMQRASRFSQRPPEFLLTHPVTQFRISDAAGRAENYPRKPRSTRFDFLLLKADAQWRYHHDQLNSIEDLQRAIDTTQAGDWRAALQVQLAKTLLQQGLTAKANKALEALDRQRDHAAVVALRAQLLPSNEALALINTALTVEPDNRVLLTTLAEQHTRAGNFRAATLAWRTQSERWPDDPAVWRGLQQAANGLQDKVTSHYAGAEHLFLNGDQPRALRQMELAIRSARQQGDFQRQAALESRMKRMASASDRL